MPTFAPIHAKSQAWCVRADQELTLNRPRLMGVLNVTPDSFSDGGSYAGVDEAVAAARRMIAEGAAIIDIGGESTRPSAESVPEDEQIRRVVPVVQALCAREIAGRFLISIDTTRSRVAVASLEAGADIINDVSAGMDDEAMLPLAASRRCGLILMHRLRKPREDSFSTHYAPGAEPDYQGDVYRVVRDFLNERVQAALAAGVRREAIVIDPGLGFGKSVAQNYELALRLGALQRDLDLPALSAASRKSFLAHSPSAPRPDALPSPQSAERLAAGVALTLSHWQMGVRLFRVHDVAAHAQALAAAAALHPEQYGLHAG